MPKGFQGAKRWLNQLVDFEKTRLRRFSAVEMKLERMQKLMQALGNPQDSVRCIHVAGTNGKGSVSHMVDNMMRGIGYTVGRYTSPHLTDVRERISVGGMEIDKAAFGDVITKVAEAAQSIDFEPTFFEAITAAAFVHFEAEAVDLAVIEVGLGGRLDCTNIIQPVLTIITKLDIDHAPILGDTLAKIAAEKAGIMKSGAPCFTLQQEPEALEVLEARAKEVGCDLYVLGREIEFSRRFGTEDDKVHTAESASSATTDNTCTFLPRHPASIKPSILAWPSRLLMNFAKANSRATSKACSRNWPRPTSPDAWN